MDENNLMIDQTFFFPNCCHVCKRYDVKLKSCLKCRMISYCNKDHQLKHLPEHEEICAAVRFVLEDKEYMNTEEISTIEWLKLRMYYLNEVSRNLQRAMKNEEWHMILFPQACVVCHRQDVIHRCNECASAAFCDKHRDDLEHREKYCKLMRKCLKIYEYIAMTENLDRPYAYVDGPPKTPFHDMKSFLDTYTPLDKDNVFLQMLHSNQITNLLTVYFCVEKLDHLRCEALNIHIVNPSTSYQEECKIWVILLMLIPTLTTLSITFIRPKIMFSEYYNSCWKNIPRIKKFVFKVHYMSYEEYVGSKEFEKPNFIVGFHANVVDDSYAQDKYVNISEQSGRVLAELKCPCILIFDFLGQTDIDILNKMKKKLFVNNPYMNLMPHRCCVTDNIMYHNNYLIIFDNLDSTQVFINNENQCSLFSKAIQE